VHVILLLVMVSSLVIVIRRHHPLWEIITVAVVTALVALTTLRELFD
jgi:hypothetical protein